MGQSSDTRPITRSRSTRSHKKPGRILREETFSTTWSIQSAALFASRIKKAYRQPLFHQRLAFYLDSTLYGRWLDGLDTLVNTVYVVNYIQQHRLTWPLAKCTSTDPHPFRVWQTVDVALGCTLILLYLPCIYTSFDRFSTLFSFYSFLTVSCLSSLFVWLSRETTCSYLAAGPFAYLFPFRVWRLHGSVNKSLAFYSHIVSRVTIKGFMLSCSILLTLLTVTCWVYLLLFNLQHYEGSFFDVFYTISVSSTSGLQTNLIPDNILSRIVNLGVMIVGAIYIPANISQLLYLIRQSSPFDAPYVPRKGLIKSSTPPEHVLIIGHLTDATALKSFFREFFCPDHGFTMAHIVILHPTEPTPELVQVLNDVAFVGRVHYIKGSPMNVKHLKKANLDTARACFVLTSPFGVDASRMDANTVMRTHAIRTFHPTLSIYVQVVLPKSIPHLLSSTSTYGSEDNILCVQGFKMGLFAANCQAPGFLNFFFQITNSLSDNTREAYLKSNSTLSHWIPEYIRGAMMEIYAVTLNQVYQGIQFKTLVHQVYLKKQAVIFAIGIPVAPRRHSVYMTQRATTPAHDSTLSSSIRLVLNPCDYYLQGNEILYMLTTDRTVADVIAQGMDITSLSNSSDVHGSTLSNVNVSSLSNSDVPNSSNAHASNANESAVVIENLDDPVESQNDATVSLGSSDDLVYRGPKIQAALHLDTEDPTQTPPSSMVFHDHILICNLSPTFPSNLAYFVAPFRNKDPTTPIVILSEGTPSNRALQQDYMTVDDWNWIQLFGHVYHVQGSPLKRKDLALAHCSTIKRAVILCDPIHSDASDRLGDAPALLVLLNIESMTPSNKDIFITIEFLHQENMKLIGKQAIHSISIDDVFDQVMIPGVVSGHCFTHSMLHSLICQVYYNPHLLRICRRLVFNYGSEPEKDGEKASPLGSSPSSHDCPLHQQEHGHFAQIPLPNIFIQRIRAIRQATRSNEPTQIRGWSFIRRHFLKPKGPTYQDVFEYLLEQGKVCLGLYRRVSRHQRDCYCVVNPAPETLVSDQDKVFVLM